LHHRGTESTEKSSCLSRLGRDKQECSVLKDKTEIDENADPKDGVFAFRYLPKGEEFSVSSVPLW
jgi:hypothetical protein